MTIQKWSAYAVDGGVDAYGQMEEDDLGDYVLYEDHTAEIEKLRAALTECQDEIDAYIQQEYPGDHPVHERYRQRDFSSNPARVALKGANK